MPVRYGKFGELKRCPARPGSAYTLKARVPYEQIRERSTAQPSRARAVLWLIDQCQEPTKTQIITVDLVERDGEEWIVHFKKGDHSGTLDSPVFLSKSGDYTMIASRQAVPGDPEVMMPFAKDLEKARRKALEGRIGPQRQLVGKISTEVGALKSSLASMKARNRLRRIEHDLKAVANELSTEVLSSAPVLAGDDPHEDAGSPPTRGALAILESVA